MDAHYDMVMNARRGLEGAPSRLYFAYSTVLDRAAFEEWRTQHAYEFFSLPEGRLGAALDVDLVYDFPSRWWGGRVAGLRDAPGAKVWGRVFEIAGVDWPIVQHKEGAITAMCEERVVRIEVGGPGGQQVIEATAFTTTAARRRMDGPVSQRFVEALERGARAAGLPAEYVAGLQGSAR